MGQVQMKYVDNGVKIKNGTGTWMRPVVDDNTGKFYRTQQDAAEATETNKSSISAFLTGTIKPSQEKWQGLRYATAEDVQKNIDGVEVVNEPKKKRGRPKGSKNKVTAKGRKKAKAIADVKAWAKKVGGPRKRGKKAKVEAAANVTMFRVNKKRKVEVYDKRHDAWNESKITVDNARKKKDWKEVGEAGTGSGEKPGQAAAGVDQVASGSSFWAVQWPDGLVTVRARAGAWTQTYASREQAPASMVQASDVFELG